MQRALPLLAFASFGAVACESIDSSALHTSGIYADLSASSDGSTTTVEARLKTGGALSNTFVELTGGDSLTAWAGMDSRGMSESSAFGAVWYAADFSATAEDTALRVAFSRSSGDESAPSSTATLPAPFSITSPMADTGRSRATDLTITWSPAGTRDRINYTVEGGDCIQLASGSVSDTGSVTIPAGELKPSPSREGASCTIHVIIERLRDGSVDPAYGEGGSFIARQVRRLSLTSQP